MEDRIARIAPRHRHGAIAVDDDGRVFEHFPPRLDKHRERQPRRHRPPPEHRSEEHTSELQSLMRTSYAVFCWKNKKKTSHKAKTTTQPAPYLRLHSTQLNNTLTD